jgi:hypothetical protein
MNEAQLIRRQIGIEREHACELLRRIESTFSMTYSNYLLYILDKQTSRATAHIERMSSRGPVTPDEEAALHNLRRALEELTRVLPAPESGGGRPPSRAGSSPPISAGQERCLAPLRDLIDSSERLEALAEWRYTIDDWRSIARIDADSVLEERRLWAEVLRHGSDRRDR